MLHGEQFDYKVRGMSHTAPLFDERAPFDRGALAERLKALARRRVYIGTSSWKYPGWIGQVYSRERYLTRGGFSEKLFEAECLREYSETFPAVCGDFTFYQFPSEQYWRRLFQPVPETLRFAFKVPEQITVRTWPQHPRYRGQAGLVNSSFLDRALLENDFLLRLEPYRARVATLIFEFGTFPKQFFRDVCEFVDQLDPFLASLPAGFRYAVEVRNPEFLDHEYFSCLRNHAIAHVFNAWSRMPELSLQLRYKDAFTTDFTVARALLRRGRPYEEAVRAFAPYEDIQDPNPEGRTAVRDIIDLALKNEHAAYIYVNNRFEGNAPRTIEAIVS